MDLNVFTSEQKLVYQMLLSQQEILNRLVITVKEKVPKDEKDPLVGVNAFVNTINELQMKIHGTLTQMESDASAKLN